MIWLMVFVIYQAPPQATNWDGPWKLGKPEVIDRPFATEAQCRNAAIQFIGRMHQGMLAPIRYKCVPFDGGLPKSAVR